MTPVTWDRLANLYDEAHSGRKARTLPMDTVFAWAEKQTDRFHVAEDGTLYLKDGAAPNAATASKE